MSLLSLRGLTKRFGARTVLDGVDLDLEAGHCYVLTGINGAGKSTLLRILAGLETGEGGSLRLHGRPVSLAPYDPALRRAVVYVHQHPVLFSGTVAENLAYGLRARGERATEVKARTAAALRWAGLEAFAQASAARLSGGERQRAALARANVLEPELLLLDEPTSNLDGAARETVIALIRSMTEQGRSLLIVCHDRDLIGLPGVTRFKLMEGRLLTR